MLGKNQKKNAEDTFEGIEKKRKINKNIDVEINKIDGKIDFLKEKEKVLLRQLEKEKDDSEDLEDFFDKRGF